MLFMSKIILGQKEANIWYFGNKAGLDFNNNPPSALSDSEMNQSEGSASISDQDGKLLFYTDGISIWNKTHKVMSNGFGLSGSSTSTHSSLIVKHPTKNNLYFVFTTGEIFSRNGVCYSLVDLNTEDGLGVVVEKNKKLIEMSSEKIAAIGHANEKDIWIVIPEGQSDVIYTFLLTSNGISSTPIVFRTNHLIPKDAVGQIKFASNSSKLAFAITTQSKVIVLDFNSISGEISNPKVIHEPEFYPYGIEFSPSSNLLYISATTKFGAGIYANKLYQCKIPKQSNTQFSNCLAIDSFPFDCQMQLGPNRKIYVANAKGDYLASINYPNKMFPNCTYIKRAIYLNNRQSRIGLPSFCNNYFKEIVKISADTVCLGDYATISINIDTNEFDSIFWFISKSFTPILNSIKTTTFRIQTDTNQTIMAKVFYADEIITYIGKIVTVNSVIDNLIEDSTLCLGEIFYPKPTSIKLDFLWPDGSTQGHYKPKESGKVWVKINSNCGESYDTAMFELKSCDCTLFFPNCITSNGDQLNDIFYPTSNCLINNYHLVIYDRWGAVIFESIDPKQGWNGTKNKDILPNGVYFYHLDAEIGEPNITKQRISTNGTITLLN